VKITKEQLNKIIKEEASAVLSEGINYFDESRKLCQALERPEDSAYGAPSYPVEWDQKHAMKILNASARRPEDYREAAKSCKCLKNNEYFDAKDPAQKKACLGF